MRGSFRKVVLRRARRATSPHPGVHVISLELPEATDPVSGHALASDPRIDAVLADAQVLGDLVDRHPPIRYVHALAICRPRFDMTPEIPASGSSGQAGFDPF